MVVETPEGVVHAPLLPEILPQLQNHQLAQRIIQVSGVESAPERFPPGWQTLNQPSRVLGLAPQQSAMVALELQGPGDDPKAAAHDYAAGDQLLLERTQSLRIGGLPAFRAHTLIHTPTGPLSAEITWVAFGSALGAVLLAGLIGLRGRSL